MFVVIFHMLYLLGKYVYDNYHVKKASAPSKDAADGETSDRQHVNDNKVQAEVDETQPVPLAELSQTVKFSPPVYIQRYLAVSNVLSDPKYEKKLRKIVDFGCAELGFLPYLKNLEGVEEILFVDVDRQVLLLNKAKAAPLVSDHLQRRSRPLKIDICMGSVVHNDKKLENTDAVVCIELIEHLYHHVLVGVPANIFGYIKPKVAVITTPNIEFNVLFPNLGGKLRHPDHKFEWTRRQFEIWAQNIVKRYPCYNVRFEGICYGPEDTKRFGACSQMAIFERKEDPSTMGIDILGVEGFFETIDTIIYPYFADKRTDNEKVLDEAIYYVNFISSRNEDASDAVYLREVLMMMQKYSISLDVLKNLMRERGYIIEELDDGPVVILPEENNSDTDEIYIEDMEFDGELSLTDDEHEMEMYDMDEDVMIENGNWNESIVITQNQTAFVQENSYLYDGEPSIEQHRPSEELAADLNNDQFSRTNIAEGISEQTVSPSKTRELAVSDATETNGVVEVANSVAIPDTTNFSLHAISQDVDVNLSKVQDYAIASFQPYLSVSRSSTSPGLLFEAELDDSLASQNLLNSTFNKSEITDEAAVKSIAEISSLVKALAQAEKNEMGISKNTYMFSSPFKINCNTGIKPNYIDSIQVCESDNIVETEQNGLQNMYSSVYDEPQSTSSPRCKKMHTTQRIKRSCLEGDDLMTALDSYTELKPTETLDEVVSDANVLKGASRKSPYSDGDADTEIINPRTPSDSENDTLKNESNTNCSPSNNSQRELCLREDKSYNEASTFVGSLQKDGCDEETAGKENLIKHETDIANVQSVVDSQHVFYPSDDDALEEYVCCELKAAVTNSCYNYVEACPRNEGEDLARPGVSGESLSAFRKLSSVQSWDNGECLSVCAKEENVLNDSFQSCEDTNNKVVQFASPLESGENVECDTKDSTSKDVNTSSVVGLTTDAEAKLPSPTFESPPDSWSHEIVDSGYPNSASGQDITPENDLSSIAQDHIPDTESPSVAEAPRFDVLEPIEVENGDLANNNRDDEGNNMVAAADANDIEGLQPLIDVLENDLENENDIYMVENGFPMWLLNLRIQEVADARYMDHDEGFDSSSSDE